MSVTLAIGQEPLEKFGMWVEYENYGDTYFFSCHLVNPICHCRVIALFKVFSLHCKPMEAIEKNISRTARARVLIFGSKTVSKCS